ncbi:sigma-70 family RNA polymerase sigma factor [Kineococcus aurantiacus]|uniref:RNA polymerase sigma factor n=1 Tax=Kineococcus aurantiacus TaxID=37633 RepID=UPI0031E0A930
MDDAQAYAVLFARHYRTVYSFTARRVGSVEAEEVTAEVFLRAWQQWETSRQRGLPWLYRTASHVVGEHLRARHRHDHLVRHLQSLAAGTGQQAAIDAETRTDQATAAAALLQLSPTDRDLLLALSWDGLTMPELAQVLGCSVPTAYVRVHRARRRLAAAEASGTPVSALTPATSQEFR